MHTRGARLDDAEALVSLAAELGYPTSATELSTRLAALLRREDDVVLVACDADRGVVGWIHAFVAVRVESERFAELGGLVVAERHRRQGVGGLLVAAARAWARERGVRKLRVRTRVGRADARRFYDRLGFVESKQQLVFDLSIEAGD